MSDRATLVELSDLAWETLQTSLSGLTEQTAWSSIQLQPGEYLHTEGSILSQIAHIASGKIIYGSVGFRNTEVRWRDMAAKVDSAWPNLDEMIAWLHEAHDYWMTSWANVNDLDEPRLRFDGSLQPTWKLIATGIHHDNYHAGQIQFQRVIAAPSSTPPPPEGKLWEGYCKDFPSW